MSLRTFDFHLEQVFPSDAASFFSTNPDDRLGVIVGGSLSKGLTVKLDAGQSIEELAVGRYVVVHGDRKRFFCMITDIVLDNTNPEIQSNPPDISDPFLRAVYSGTTAYGKVHVQPLLSLEEGTNTPLPVKTIPAHFMNVHNATADEVNNVFGEDDDSHFYVGNPLELEDVHINIDLKRLVERSIGVFGKSGTGKSFFTRMLLAGVIKKKQAVALIFDMHNDYGFASSNEGGSKTKGLGELMPDDVRVCVLDPESARRRKVRPDFEVTLGYDAIEPEDLEMLRETMGLSDAMIDAAHMLRKRWHANWIQRLLNATTDDIDDIEANTPTRGGTLMALQRRVQRFERWEFLVPETLTDSVENIITLIQQGKSVVLEFGKYGNSLEAYILVANYLTRRIHTHYVDRVEKSLGDNGMKPPQLLIVIEEAHKFLEPRIANQTIFGIIAREMRKYNVTMLVVDQRPSGIDEEVMSQIGTRVTALLDNERDINAVLMGINGANGLREVLARLDSKQQAIIMGHAVPMPVVVKTRSYDQAFYDAINGDFAGHSLPSVTGLGSKNGKNRSLR